MKFSTSALALCLALSTVAHAQEGSPNTPSGRKTRNLKMRFEPSDGRVPVVNGEAAVEGGYAQSGDQSGGSVRVKASDKWLINGNVTDTHAYGAVALTPGIDARAVYLGNDASGHAVRDVEANVTAVTFAHGQAREKHSSPKVVERGEGFMKRRQALEAIESEARHAYYEIGETSEFQNLKECEAANWGNTAWRCSQALKDAFGGDVEKAKARLAELEAARKVQSDKADKARTDIGALDAEAQVAGYKFGRLCDKDSYGDYNKICYRGPDDEYGATVEGNVATVGARYRKDTRVGLATEAAAFSLGDSSFEVGGRLNGVNLRLCGAITPVTLLAGKHEGQAYYESAVRGCAGLDTGAGNIFYSVGYTTDWEHYSRVEQRVDVKNVAGTPFGAYYSHEKEQGSNGAATTDFVGVQVAR